MSGVPPLGNSPWSKNESWLSTSNRKQRLSQFSPELEKVGLLRHLVAGKGKFKAEVLYIELSGAYLRYYRLKPKGLLEKFMGTSPKLFNRRPSSVQNRIEVRDALE